MECVILLHYNCERNLSLCHDFVDWNWQGSFSLSNFWCVGDVTGDGAAPLEGEVDATGGPTGRPVERNQVTLQEEDKISAYYAGGYLYALDERGEPYL